LGRRREEERKEEWGLLCILSVKEEYHIKKGDGYINYQQLRHQLVHYILPVQYCVLLDELVILILVTERKSS
jgi:hypothetical protein